MGWLWSSSKDDPVQNLEPGLREYLEREAPSQDYSPSSRTDEMPATADVPQHAQKYDPETLHSTNPPVPSASLFPDGRYAHIWKNYKPPTDSEEAAVKSVEKVIDKHKQRKDTVQRAAMENCALEQEELALCFRTGNWQKRIKARVTMCSEENSSFSRCYTTQAKFLQALGYASSFDWDDEKEERIQMHADKLYHQMLDYEKRVESAQAAGQEPPPLTSLFNPKAEIRKQKLDGTSLEIEIPGGEQIPTGFKLSKDIEELTPHERELEIRVHKAQSDQHNAYVEKVSPFIKDQDNARQKRREVASRWFGETIARWIT